MLLVKDREFYIMYIDLILLIIYEHVKIILGYTHLRYTDLRVTSSEFPPFVGEKVSTK